MASESRNRGQYNRPMSDHPVHAALYTAAQVRALDARAIERNGVSGFDLMQRAAWAAFESLRRRWPQARRLCVLCGPGKNGGDGYLLALLAREAGFAVEVLALGAAGEGDAVIARERWLAAGGTIIEIDAAGFALPPAEVYVDALFGTGLARPLENEAAAAVTALNDLGAPLLALDVPSGLCADTGRVLGTAVRASACVSFVAWKRGLFTHEGPDHCGELELATLDLPASLYHEADARLLAWPQARNLLPPRRKNSHKGCYGHVLAIGGDIGMGGAIRLAAEAALRVGAGLVSVATRAEHVSAINAARPEAMVAAVDGPQDLKPLLERASVLALGPGLGTRAWGHAHWRTALARELPAVLDADALNLLAREPRRFDDAAVVLTPHPGEAARLLGRDMAAVQGDRFAAARELARRFHAVVVLKGAGSLIAAPDGELALCRWGNPGMASGGMGDVLSGVIAALLAQGLKAFDAARFGVALHARAGDAVARTRGQVGLVASDLFAPLQRELNPVDTDD